MYIYNYSLFIYNLDAISRVGADQVLGVDFSRDDADVRVPPGALVSVRALAQRIGVDLLHVCSLLGRKQPARLFPPAPQPLRYISSRLILRHFIFKR